MKEITQRFSLDGQKRRLVFNGGCSELIPICRAMCCREWDVFLSDNEHAAHRFQSENLCLMSRKLCAKCTDECFNRATRLKKKEDGSCVYLTDECTCDIYENRPEVCRSFTCTDGWKLESVYTAIDTRTNNYRLFLHRFRDSMIFVHNPLRQFKTCFYTPDEKQIVLVVRCINKCGLLTLVRFLDIPHLSDTNIQVILEQFSTMENIGTLYRNITAQQGIALTEQEWFTLLALFCCEELIVYKYAP